MKSAQALRDGTRIDVAYRMSMMTDEDTAYLNTQAWRKQYWCEEFSMLDYFEKSASQEILGATREIVRKLELRQREGDPIALITKAEEFARIKHAGQHYGHKYPFTRHLNEVNDNCRRYGKTAQLVAWLHDVLEATDTTPMELLLEFGEYIMVLVQICTDPRPVGVHLSRKAVKARAHALWAQVPKKFWTALIVKTGDRLANVEACLSTSTRDDKRLLMYRKEHAEFRAAVYRPGLCDYLWERLDSALA